MTRLAIFALSQSEPQPYSPVLIDPRCHLFVGCNSCPAVQRRQNWQIKGGTLALLYVVQVGGGTDLA